MNADKPSKEGLSQNFLVVAQFVPNDGLLEEIPWPAGENGPSG
jgi:hypothetical protein